VGWGGVALVAPDGKPVLTADGRRVYVGRDGRSLLGADGRPLLNAAGAPIVLAASVFTENGVPVLGPDGKSVTIAPDGKGILGQDGKPVTGGQPVFVGGDGKSVFLDNGKSAFSVGRAGIPLVDPNGTIKRRGDQGDEGALAGFVVVHAEPILESSLACLRRAQQITNEMIQKSGPLENEKLIVRCAQELSEAAAFLLLCAEVLMGGIDAQAPFKVITAGRIIKASVSSLVAQVLVKGGDSEGVMSDHVKNVVLHTDKIIAKAEHVALDQAKLAESKIKAAPNKMIRKLNMQGRINDTRKQQQEAEKALYQFRKRF
jgi:hypothetical protein